MKTIESIFKSSDISGLIPGVRGQRAFPSPRFKNSDPFLLMDHIGPDKVGTDWQLNGEGHDHPHRGFETLTFMFEGRMDHRDSLGNRSTLTSGSVQRMNAGSGIIHGGIMFSDRTTARFHEMQLWINNPREQKMSSPGVQNVTDSQIPVIEYSGIRLRVISGELNGIKGPIQTLAPTQIGHLLSDESGSMVLSSITDKANAMIYVLEGGLSVAGQPIKAYELAKLSNEGEDIKIEMTAHSQALVLAGNPLNEPVVFGGPFVMNTEEEISQANLDFQQGKFGDIKK